MRLAAPQVVTSSGDVNTKALADALKRFADQINATSEGQVVGATNAQIAVPTTGTHNQGDVIRNKTPSGATPVLGWICTVAGTPGTFVAITAGTVTNTGTLTNNAVVVGNGGVDVSTISVGTNGQLLLGATGADPAFATMSGDATITAAGVLTITGGGGSTILENQVFGG